jgi:hypothetical protein
VPVGRPLVFALLLAAPARAVEPPPADLSRELQALRRLAACGGDDAALPATVERAAVEAHCRALRKGERRYQRRWLARARPFLARLVPPRVPDKVVYPFGGGDLTTALATFPDATEITTLSLEPAGDVRALAALDGEALPEALGALRDKMDHLFRMAHSKTRDMGKLARDDLPAQLVYALVALEVHGLEPIQLRYFQLQPDGTIRYASDRDLDAGADPAARARWLRCAEIVFRAPGEGAARVYRHIAANLDDAHLAADPSVLRHLEAKGTVAAITKAASYLLWWREFSRIRGYLLEHMEWMISDSTGIPPSYARPAGFAQEVWGRFDGPLFPGNRRQTDGMVELFAASPARRLSFRFGYPDAAGHAHLMVTRRAAPR